MPPQKGTFVRSFESEFKCDDHFSYHITSAGPDCWSFFGVKCMCSEANNASCQRSRTGWTVTEEGNHGLYSRRRSVGMTQQVLAFFL